MTLQEAPMALYELSNRRDQCACRCGVGTSHRACRLGEACNFAFRRDGEALWREFC